MGIPGNRGWQRTKIVCTLGPATDPPGVVERLIECGMDVARVNTSHGNHAEHAERIQRVRRAAEALGQPVAILVDLPGPKFRLGDLPGGSRELAEGAIVTLMEEGDDRRESPHAEERGKAREGGNVGEGAGIEEDSNAEASGDPKAVGNVLPVRNRELLQALRAGELLFLADGSVELRVTAAIGGGTRSGAKDGCVRCEVLIGGTVRSGSGINVPESALGMLIPTDDDRRHLAFAVSQEAEWVGVSFVQSADDLARVRACLPSGPDGQPLLMAKIEKRRALADLDAIVEASDGVMVARGDLGVETDLAKIPIVQKRIIAAANDRGRPVVTATQMLESMVDHEHPTRAEVTDVANAVLDGTDAVMLSAETAIGAFPVAAVRILGRVLTATEEAYGEPGYGLRRTPDSARSSTAATAEPAESAESDNALNLAACLLAARLRARAIIVPVRTLPAAMGIARLRPQALLVMVADCARLHRSLALVRGISPLVFVAELKKRPGPQAYLAEVREWLLSRQLAQPDDQAVLVLASEDGGKTDALRIVRLSLREGEAVGNKRAGREISGPGEK